MKTHFVTLVAVLLSWAANSPAGTPSPAAVAPPKSAADQWSSKRPDGHAPIGVMFDHAHHAGEWMLGYRFFWSHYEGMRQGDHGIASDAVFHLHSPMGVPYAATVLDMDMFMHMWEVMYAPTDWLTLMVMPQYMEMDMTMKSSGHGMSMMSGGHGMSMMGDGSDGHGMSGTHSHGTSGWGDTIASATFTLFNAHRQSLLATVGMSFPTGSVSEGSGGTFTHYGMQLGSGTFDLLPSVTYLGEADRISWGLQYASAIRLEDANDSGFRFGDVHSVTAWSAYRICDWVSFSGRIAYRHEGQIHGGYNGPHKHRSPPDFQSNYGGDTLDLGVGLNFYVPKGALKGNRLAIEVLFPVYQDLNGVQVERDFTLVAGWQWAF